MSSHDNDNQNNDNRALVQTTTRNPFARVAAEEQRGSILKMGKDGHWTSGAEDEPMDDVTLLADMTNLAFGSRKWVDGKIEEMDVGFVASGFVPKRREALGDNDESVWPLDSSGKRTDPWQFGYFLRLLSDDGKTYLYNATSYGGKAAIGNLCAEYVRKQINPFIKLTSSSYRHKLYGKTFNPVLQVIGWDEGDSPSPAPPAPTLPDGRQRGSLTITSGRPAAPEIDDSIPF